MFWQNFELLLNKIFERINTTNTVPAPDSLWADFGTEIKSLANVNAEQFVWLSNTPEVISPKPVEFARLLFNLKQRMAASDDGRPLTGKLRAIALRRQRPPFNLLSSTLAGELGKIAEIGQNPSYSQFQVEGWTKVLNTFNKSGDLAIVAPTGVGKSEVFMLPLMHQILKAYEDNIDFKDHPRFVLIYPRVTLLKDQLERIFRYSYWAEKDIIKNNPSLKENKDYITNSIIIGFQFAGIAAKREDTLSNRNIFEDGKKFKIVDKCPICQNGDLETQRSQNGVTPLKGSINYPIISC